MAAGEVGPKQIFQSRAIESSAEYRDLSKYGWGGRIRTSTVCINSAASYRLDHAPVVSRTSYNTAIWFAQVVSGLANVTRLLFGSL